MEEALYLVLRLREAIQPDTRNEGTKNRLIPSKYAEAAVAMAAAAVASGPRCRRARLR